MTDIRTKVSLLLLLLHNIQMLFWGLLLALLPAQVLGVSSMAYLGRTWLELKNVDSNLTDLVEFYMRFWGVQGVLLAVVFTFIAFTSYIKKEKWAWLAVFICATVGWCSAMLLDIKLGVAKILWIDMVPLLFAYASLLIQRKNVFHKIENS
jgi:Na+/glutamate symporter